MSQIKRGVMSGVNGTECESLLMRVVELAEEMRERKEGRRRKRRKREKWHSFSALEKFEGRPSASRLLCVRLPLSCAQTEGKGHSWSSQQPAFSPSFLTRLSDAKLCEDGAVINRSASGFGTLMT